MDETMKLAELLQASPFLEGCSTEEVRRVAAFAQLAEYQTGALIFREGECLSRIFLILEGSVSLETYTPARGARRLQTLQPGELLGWSPLLDQPTMTATARALKPSRLIALDSARTLALCQTDTAFGFRFMKRLARVLAARLTATRQMLSTLCAEALPEAPGIHEGAD